MDEDQILIQLARLQRKIAWNQVIYADCMDEEKGLPTLPDNSVEYAITDIPFNIKYGQCGFNRKGKTFKLRDKKLYDDQMSDEDYMIWCKSWFKELKRIVEYSVIIYCGGTQRMLNWVLNIERPYAILYLYVPNSNSPLGGNMTALTRIHPILVYRKPKCENIRELRKRFNDDTFKYSSLWGFLSDHKYIHPCPLNYHFWKDLIKRFRPESVIDPFLGSGTTSQVCEELKVKWIGFEINREYQPDLQYRLKKVRGQKKLGEFV